jgi:outer membrane protein assembly factor BamB
MKKRFISFFLVIMYLLLNPMPKIPYAVEQQNIPKIKWIYPLNISSSKSISGDIALDSKSNVYISVQGEPGYSNGRLLAINANGLLKWNYPVRNFLVTPPMLDNNGRIFLYSSPSLYAIDSNGSLLWEMEDFSNLCHLSLGSNHNLYGSDCTKGAYTRKIWSINTTGIINWSVPYENVSKITLDSVNNVLLFHLDRFEREIHLICLDEKDGSQLWKYLLKDDMMDSTGIAISPDNSLLINLKNSLLSLSSKGIFKWEIKSFCSKNIPLIDQNGIIYAANEKENTLIAFFPDGKIKWKKEGATFSPSFITTDDTIHYFKSNATESLALHASDQEGEDLWSIPFDGNTCSPVVGKKGTIFAIDATNLVSFQSVSPLSTKGWPRARHDNQNTNCPSNLDISENLPKKVTIEMSIGSTIANVNNFPQIIDAPFIYHNRTYLPFRLLGDFIGAAVNFTQSDTTKLVNTVSYETQNKCISLFIDNYKVLINGDSSLLDSPPILRNHRTYVPVRFVSEALGASVTWDQKTETVTILYEE